MTDDIKLTDFPGRTMDKVRFRDIDRQGHVNNAVFSTYLETGRVELFSDPAAPFAEEGCFFAVVRMSIEFRVEIHAPGTVEIGTGVASVGRSSYTCRQALFQDGKCVAKGETVMVQVDRSTRKSRPLSEDMIRRLSALMGSEKPE